MAALGLACSAVADPTQGLPMPSLPYPPNGTTNPSGNLRLSWSGTSENLVWNGGFEAGLDEGWTQRPEGDAAFGVVSTFGPAHLPIRPASGSYFVLAPEIRSPGRTVLSQQVPLPPTASRLVLDWWALLRAATPRPGAEFRVEVQSADGLPLAIVFASDRFQQGAMTWQRQEAALDAFAGQDVVLAFVFESGPLPRTQVPTLGLDEIRLSGWSAAQGEFEVYLGRNMPLTTADRLARTPDLAVRLPEVARSTRYYWQVTTVRGADRMPGPVWEFTTAATGATASEVGWLPPASPQVVAHPQPLAVGVVDAFGRPPAMARGTVRLSAAAPGLRPSTILIAEVDPGPRNAVEFVNASSRPIPLEGMRVDLYNGSSRVLSHVFPAGIEAAPGDVFVLHAKGPAGQYPDLGLPSHASFGWSTAAGNTATGVILYDAGGAVLDLFCGTGMDPGTFGATSLDAVEWRSGGAGNVTFVGATWQRFGHQDRDERSDWRALPGTVGQRNDRLEVPFARGNGAVEIDPNTLTLTSRPAVTNDLRFLASADRVDLFAQATIQVPAPFRQTLRTVLAVLPAPPLTLEQGAPLREGDGVRANAVILRLPSPRPTNVIVQLELAPNDQARLGGDGTVVIPAGTTLAVAAAEAIDDSLLDGAQFVELRGTSDGFHIPPLLLPVDDNETATLTLELPPTVLEGSTASGFLRVEPAPDRAVTARLFSEAPDTLTVAPSVLVPAGVSRVEVAVTAPDNHRLTGPRRVRLHADVGGWPPFSQTVVSVADNDPTTLRVVLPREVAEGSAPLPDAGLVLLGGYASSNMVIRLVSSRPAELQVPAAVTLPAGEMLARFPLTPGDDTVADGAQSVTVTASWVDLAPGSADIRVADNEPARIEFLPTASPQQAGEPFEVQVRAFDLRGEPLGGTSPDVRLRAEGAAGLVPLAGDPTARFLDGAWSGNLVAEQADRAVRLVAEVNGTRFESAPFNVLASPVAATTDLNSLDLAWDATRQRLIASVGPEDARYPNRLAVLDPQTGAVTKTLEAGPFGVPGPAMVREGRLLIVGDALYVSARGATRVQQYDLASDTLTREITVEGHVGDLAAVPGRPGFVLVGLTEGSTSMGLQLITPTDSRFGSERAATLLVPGEEPGLAYGYVENTPFPWYRIEVGPDGTFSAQSTMSGLGVWAAGDVRRLDREIIVGSGQVVDTATFELPRRYQVQGTAALPWNEGGSGRVEFSEDGTHLFFVAREAAPSSTHRLEQFRRDMTTPRRVTRLATTASNARRLLRAGTETLAFNTSERVYYVRAGWLTPTGPFAAVEVRQTADSSVPLLGQEFTLNLEVLNRGPGDATDLIVENQLEPNFELLEATVSSGSATVAGEVWRWHQLGQPAGHAATARLRVRARMAGILTNEVAVFANQWNPALPSGFARFTTPVRLAPQFEVALPVAIYGEDLASDDGRGLLYVASTQDTVVAVDPATGLPLFEIAAGGRPHRLALSDEGRFLYVAIRPGQIRRLDVATREFDVSWNVPGIVHDVAIMPGRPRTVAVASGDDGTRHLSVYDDGAARLGGVVTGAGLRLLTFPDNPDRLFAWADTFGGPRLTRYGVGGDGISGEAYTDHNFGQQAGRMLHELGRLYLASGEVLNADSRSLVGRLPGTIDISQVAVDASLHRIFSLGGETLASRLQVHDLTTWARLGAFALPLLQGRPRALVRWGADGLALLTDADPLLVMRVTDVPVNSPANLAVGLEPSGSPAAVGGAVVVRATLRNLGPNPTEAATLAVRLPTVFGDVALSSAEGSCTNDHGVAICRAPVLAAGAQAILRIEGRPQAAGTLLFEATGTSRASEADWADNHARLPLPVGLPSTRDLAFPFQLQAIDAIPNPGRNRFYASIGPDDPSFPNSVVVVDPATGSLRPLIGGLPGPSLLAVSSDDSRLYVATEGARQVLRVRTATGQADLFFALQTPDRNYAVHDLEVAPHNPDRLVVGTTVGEVIAIDNGQVLGGMPYWGREVEFYASDELLTQEPSSVPAASFRLSSRPDGLAEIERLGSDLFGGSIAAAGDWLFSTGGLAFRLPDVVPLGMFSSSGPVAPDLASGRVVFLERLSDGTLTLRACALDHFGELGHQPVGVANTVAGRLHRWGVDGLAYVADARLHVIRSSLLPRDPPANLDVRFVTRPADGNRQRVVVRNTGPAPARNVVVQLQAPAFMRLTAVEAPGASVTRIENTGECRYAELPAGAETAIRITLANDANDAFALQALAWSDASDPDLRNNRSAAVGGRAVLDASGARLLALPAQHLAVGPDTRQLWIAVSPEQGWPAGILELDPVTGQPTRFSYSDGVPSRLAVAPNGRFLYTVLGRRVALQRFQLPTLEPDLRFPVADATYRSIYDLHDLAVAPGDGQRVAVTLGGGAVRVFDDGRVHPDASPEATPASFIEFETDPDLLWGVNATSSEHGVRRFRITGAEVTLDAFAASLQNPFGSDFRMHQGRLFLATGDVLDGTTLARLALLTAPALGTLVAMDPLPGRVVLGSSSDVQFFVHDAQSLQPVGTFDLTAGGGDRRSLVRWGADGLAFVTPGHLVLARSDLLGPLPGQDTDGDGLPDAWELEMGFSPIHAQSAGDADGDGASDVDEYAAGTDARDPEDAFRLELEPPGTLTFRSVRNRRYQVERTASLPGGWNPTGPVHLGTGDRLTLELGLEGKAAFVRVRVVP